MGRRPTPAEEYVCKFKEHGCGQVFQQGCRLQKSRHQQRCSFNPEKQHASVVNNTTNNNTTNNNTTNNITINNITINISVLPFGEEDMDSVIAAFSSAVLKEIVRDPEHAITEFVPNLVWFNKDKPEHHMFVAAAREFKMKMPDGNVVTRPTEQEILQVGMKHYQNIVNRAASENVLGPINERLNELYSKAVDRSKTEKISRYCPFFDVVSDGEINPESLAEALSASIKTLAHLERRGKVQMNASQKIVDLFYAPDDSE